jgi:hypothetical protein
LSAARKAPSVTPSLAYEVTRESEEVAAAAAAVVVAAAGASASEGLKPQYRTHLAASPCGSARDDSEI